MHNEELTSDSGFIMSEVAMPSATFSDITLLHSIPNTHSELYTATRMGKRFVLKTLKREHRNNELYRGMLYNEFTIGYNLSHPNIAQVISFEHVETLGEAIIIEHIDGITLKEAIEKRSIAKSEALKIICELCDALHYIHSLQIIHRDLKPENIMLTHNGTNVKLIDFGLACSDSQTLYKQPAGTRRYASPELLKGEKLDNRSDIYALGVIIPLIMGGRRAREISKWCLSHDRNNRYSDTLQIKSELTRPSRWRFVALALGIIALIATSSYVTYRYTSIHTPAVATMITSDHEQINDLYNRVESMADMEYRQYYAQYAEVKTKGELDAIMLFKDKQQSIEAKAVAMLNEVVSAEDSGYAHYLSMVQTILENTWRRNYVANIDFIQDAIYRTSDI